MPRFDPQLVTDQLAPLIARYVGIGLTPAEHAEVVRIAQGFGCKDSAAAAGISPETIRARRKRVYRKLGVNGSNDVLATLLGRSLAMLARTEPEKMESVALPAQQAGGQG